jgi:3-oxoacyl-[acyl-carrier protein] reductase
VKKLQGKVALVTGAGRGIGRAIALKLSSEGAHVVVNDMDASVLDEVVAVIRDSGAEVTPCVGSVTDAEFPARFIALALEQYGGLDIIVNNAGFTWDNVIQKMSDDQFQAVMDVHVTAPFRILRAAADPIRALAKKESSEGREVFRKVVNISSVSGLGGNAGQVNYAAAKAGVVGMTKTLSKEWGRYKVNVNCVAFGFIATRMSQPLGNDNVPVDIGGREVRYGVQPSMLEALVSQQIPLGRLGTPEEAADGVYLLCSPESNYISGQVLTVGGGIVF